VGLRAEWARFEHNLDAVAGIAQAGIQVGLTGASE